MKEKCRCKCLWKIVPITMRVVLIGWVCLLIAYVYCAGIEKGFLQTIDRNGTRTLIFLLAGIIGWYFLYRRTMAVEQGTRIAEQALTVDRLNRAIEQLGSDKPSVRLGGISGLKQIADAHEEERTRIMQVLVARIGELVKLRKEDRTTVEDADIEIAFTELANIAKPLESQKGKFFKLSGIDLSGLSFSHIDLSYFPLHMTILSQVYFFEVDFTDADLNFATIDKVTFDNCEGLTKEQVMDALWREGGRPVVLPEEWDLPIANLHPLRES